LLRGPGPLVGGVRSLTAAVLRGWLRVYHRLTIVGCENLPAGGSFVLVANHASHLDALCLLAALPWDRRHRTFPTAAGDYFFASGPLTRLLALTLNALPLDRHFAPWHSLAVCGRLLEEPGNVLILFPEGTRSAGGEPGEFKPGVALLAAGRDVPVVPCYLAGTDVALPKGAWLPRPRTVRLTIGKPRVYADVPPSKAAVKRICCELREAVVALGRTGAIVHQARRKTGASAAPAAH
jgi:1-acyl-sn-glycerol-3-phosphate acyltransferase